MASPVVGKDPTTISIGSGALYIAPLGTSEPASLSLAFPSTWVPIGYTEKGTTFTRAVTAADVDVAEEYYSVDVIITAYKITVDFAFSQMTAQNYYWAMNGGTITTNLGDVFFDPPAAGTETAVMIGWTSTALDEAYIWRQCLQVGATATSRQKVLPQALIPVSFELMKPASKQPWRWMGTGGSTGIPNRVG
jgi:hypothetical protein